MDSSVDTEERRQYGDKVPCPVATEPAIDHEAKQTFDQEAKSEIEDELVGVVDNEAVDAMLEDNGDSTGLTLLPYTGASRVRIIGTSYGSRLCEILCLKM